MLPEPAQFFRRLQHEAAAERGFEIRVQFAGGIGQTSSWCSGTSRSACARGDVEAGFGGPADKDGAVHEPHAGRAPPRVRHGPARGVQRSAGSPRPGSHRHGVPQQGHARRFRAAGQHWLQRGRPPPLRRSGRPRSCAQNLQGVQDALAEALAVQQHPVVGPARQQFQSIKVHGPWIRSSGPGCAGNHPGGPVPGHPEGPSTASAKSAWLPMPRQRCRRR
jgi:hypothetical protein